jgi:hypothetical protein
MWGSPRRHGAHREKKERPTVNSSTAEDAEDAEGRVIRKSEEIIRRLTQIRTDPATTR